VNPDAIGSLIPLVLIVLAFWLLVIRPARRRQQEMTRIQNSVMVGSEVMLGSGIFGTVVAVGDETLTLAIAPGTEVKVARQAVVRVVDSPAVAPGGTAQAEGTPDHTNETPEQP
jgi:preprotein translocase subunit YajC